MRRIVEKLWVLLLARILMAAGFSLSFPFLALYFNKERGVPLHWVGALLSFNVLASGVAAAVGGTVSDRWGRKPVMVFAMAARCLALFAMYLAVDGQAHVATIAGLHLVSAMLGSLYDPASSAWVADQLPHHERVRAHALMRTGGNLGWTIGPAIGGFAAASAYAALFLGTACVYVAATALVIALVRESDRSASSPSGRGGPPNGGGVGLLVDAITTLRDPKLLQLCVGIAVLGAVMSQLIAPLSLYAVRFAGLTERELGLLFSLNGGIVALSQVALIQTLRRYRLTTMLVAGAALYGAGYGLVGVVDGFAALAAVTVVITLGEMVCAPAEHALAANIAPADQRGRYIGLASLATQLGWAAGPLAAGFLLERWGMVRPSPYWLGIGALALVSAAIFAGIRHKVSRREEGMDLEEALEENDRTLQPT